MLHKAYLCSITCKQHRLLWKPLNCTEKILVLLVFGTEADETAGISRGWGALFLEPEISSGGAHFHRGGVGGLSVFDTSGTAACMCGGGPKLITQRASSLYYSGSTVTSDWGHHGMRVRCILRKQSHLLSLNFERGVGLFLAVKSTLIRMARAGHSLQGVCRFHCDSANYIYCMTWNENRQFRK